MLKIRPFRPFEAEYEAIVAINNANWSDNPKTVGEEQHSDANRNPAYFFNRLVGELSGEIIVIGECGETFWLEEPDQYYWHFNILPNYVGQGFEEQMYDALIAQLAIRNPRKLFVGMRDDQTEQVQFIEGCGYRLIQREPTSYLDVKAFTGLSFSDLMANVHQLGIQIFDVRHLQRVDSEWILKLWQLQWEIKQDVPGTNQAREPFENFEKRVNDPKFYDAKSHFVAVQQSDVDGGKVGSYIGMTRLTYNTVDPTIGDTHLTGVVKSYRRKGIATALKVHAITIAKAQGVRQINTMNNETNPMLGLNVRLGFKPGPSWLYYEKVL